VAQKRAARIVAVFGSMRSKVVIELTAQYPNKKAYMSMDNAVHLAFLRALRTEDNKNTDAYAFARAWLIETYGGLRNKEGTGFKSAERNNGPIPFNVYMRTLSVKLESTFEYLEKAPTEDIEPEMLADMRTVHDSLHAAWVILETYRELERAAAESDKALADAKAKSDKDAAKVALAQVKAAAKAA
jgi:hypothetical protein